jgi:putative membrane protein
MTPTLRWALLGSALAILPLGACSTADKAATTVQSAAQAQVNPTLSTTDTNFINQAAAGGLAEVKLGELASQKGGTKAVRGFGAQMVHDHTPVNNELMRLAQRKQLSPSTTLDAPSQSAYDKLNGERGRAFDQDYLSGQLSAHQDQLQLFQNEAQNGTDPDVRAFAQQHVGLIQKHVDELRRMTATGSHHARKTQS